MIYYPFFFLLYILFILCFLTCSGIAYYKKVGYIYSNLVLIFFFFHEFLIFLTQYSDASRSRYVESILNSLQRIENRIENLKVFQETKQAEQSTLNCLVPAEKIFNLISELSKIPNNDNNEVHIY